MMKFQIGKSGVTEGVIESLRLGFKTHNSIRISILRSYASSKAKVREMADEIITRLGEPYIPTLIGFTIILRKA